MSVTPSSTGMPEKQPSTMLSPVVGEPVPYPQRTQPPRHSAYTRLDTTDECKTYRHLRVALIVLGTISAVLAIASLIVHAFILAHSGRYSGYDRIKHEKEEAGGDQSMEGESLTLSLFQLFYSLCLFAAVYCLIVLAASVIPAMACSRSVMAPGCCPAACLATTVLIGVALSVVEVSFCFALPPDGIRAIGALPVVRIIFMIPYLVLLIISACMFDDSSDN